MAQESLEDMALVTFLQALAVTVWKIDDLPLEDRNRDSLIRVFDGYLGEITTMALRDGQDVRAGVANLRAALERALEQMRSTDEAWGPLPGVRVGGTLGAGRGVPCKRGLFMELRAFQKRFLKGALADGVDVAALSIPRGNG